MAVASRQLTFQLSGGPPYGIRLHGGDGSPFVVSKIRSASKAEAVGLQECDVIVAVNGITTRGLSHSTLTALMDSFNTTLSVMALRGHTAFSDVETIQNLIGSQLTTLSQSQSESLVASQPQLATPPTNSGFDGSTFILQPVIGKQRQYKNQPTDVAAALYGGTRPDEKAADSFYARDEQRFDEDGVTRHSVEETERKSYDGTRMTTVTRREYSTRSTTSQDGPQIARDFFQADFPSSVATVRTGKQVWFGERTEDGTRQTRIVEHVDEPNYRQQQSWTVAGVPPNESSVRFAPTPQVRVYQTTDSHHQMQNTSLPDFNISIEAVGSGGSSRIAAGPPVVTVTPAEEYDLHGTQTLAGPSMTSQRLVRGHKVRETVNSTLENYGSSEPVQLQQQTQQLQQQQHQYGYGPEQDQDTWNQTQQPQPQIINSNNTSSSRPSYNYESHQQTPVEISWSQPASAIQMNGLPITVRHQGHVDDVTVTMGKQSHFTVKNSSDAQYHVTQPYQLYQVAPSSSAPEFNASPPRQAVGPPRYADLPTQSFTRSTPVDDVYHNLYQDNNFAAKEEPSADSRQFDFRSKPAPPTFRQPYQQTYQQPFHQPPSAVVQDNVSYRTPFNAGNRIHTEPVAVARQQPVHQTPVARVGDGTQSNYGYSDSFHQPLPAPMRTGTNRLPLNPSFKVDEASHLFAEEIPFSATSSSFQHSSATFAAGQPEPTPNGIVLDEMTSGHHSRPPTAHTLYGQPQTMTSNVWNPRSNDIVDAGYHVSGNVVMQPPSGYLLAAAPPPPPPPPPNPYKVYGITTATNDAEHRQMQKNVILANSVAKSVTSPANSNSRGQKMFLRRQQNAHKWTKSGPDPVPETFASSAATSAAVLRQGHLPSASIRSTTDRWNASPTDPGVVRQSGGGASLLRRSDSADQIVRDAAVVVSAERRSVDSEQRIPMQYRQSMTSATTPSGPTVAYRPIRLQLQKSSTEQAPMHKWNQSAVRVSGDAPETFRGFDGRDSSTAVAGYTDL